MALYVLLYDQTLDVGGDPLTLQGGQVIDDDEFDIEALSAAGFLFAPIVGGGGADNELLAQNGVWTSAAGLDGWTYVKLDAPVTATDTNPVDVFTLVPEADTTYIIEVMLLLRTDNTGAAPNPGVTWPTGYSDGAAIIYGSNGGLNTSFAILRIPAGTDAAQVNTGGLPSTTASSLYEIKALLVMGATPGGNFAITLRSESTIDVHARAGSVMRYRAIPN